MTNHPKTTLSQWAIFNAVIDCGGYLKAAQKLNRSHSSLHHAVAKLQQHLGVQLIEIDGKTLHLTSIGKVMHRRSNQLLKDATDLEKLVDTLGQGWETEITLAVEALFPRSILTPILKKFHDSNPVTRLKIESVVLNGAAEMIKTSAADLVISTIVPQGYLGSSLTSIGMFLFAHRDHPLVTTHTPVSQRELTKHLQIVIGDTTKAANDLPFGWLKPEQRWTVSDFSHARDILLSGRGFCWMPEFAVADLIEKGEILPINTKDTINRLITLYLVTPEPERMGRGVELLSALIREEGRNTLPS
ncbi:MAG: LysR family transcriptional regulator [Sneathiella sp.]